MRKIFSIALISIHLFANTELGEIFKFPQIISHYFQHSRLNPGLDFFEFLSMHFGGDDGTTADDSEDNKLPYQNSNAHSFSFAYTAILRSASHLENIQPGVKSIYGGRLYTGISSKHVLLILQPPRA